MDKITQQYLILYLLINENLYLGKPLAGCYSFDHVNSLSKLSVSLSEVKDYIYRYDDIYDIEIPLITIDNISKELNVNKIEQYNNCISNYKRLFYLSKYQTELSKWIKSNFILYYKIKPRWNKSTNFVDITLQFKECISKFDIKEVNSLTNTSANVLYNNNIENKYTFIIKDKISNLSYCIEANRHMYLNNIDAFYTFDIYSVVEDSITIKYWKRKDIIAQWHKEEINDIAKFSNIFI